jgi:hypothetical protein
MSPSPVSLAVADSGWQLKLTGWPWWLVLLLAGVAVWALVRLHRLELETVLAKTRRRLMVLRGAALALLVLLLMEPALMRRTSERVLPLVAVVVDQSGSMAVKDGIADSSRYERAVTLAQQKVVPALDKSARVKVLAMDTGLSPLDLSRPSKLLANSATDFEATFSAVAHNWAQEYVGGVVLLTDGRQTTGADPAPVIRSLRARGALVSGILVGDPGTPPDAVVAELSGSSEVFLGETVPLTVRYRITGTNDLDFDLVLTREGKEIERRMVRGNGQWQYENFAFASTNAGINLYQARLEVAREQSTDWAVKPSGSVTLELWKNLPGDRVTDLVENAAYKKPCETKMNLTQLEYANRGEQYGGRVRGFLIPPQSGNHTFWIGSDDSSEFWLSPSENPGDKAKAAFVSGFVPRGQWAGQPSQKSQPVTLRAKHAYYFELLHKQGSGEDYACVGWQLPDNSMERPIPSARLSIYDDQALAAIAERRKVAAQARTNEWKEASLANNSTEFSVVVNQDPIKVLLVDSTPRWESRYLASMFERDRRVNFTRRYHSVIFQDRNLALLPKTQAEWDSFDMVCLGDLDGSELPPEQQGYLANFVAHRGGFLVCLAGPRGLPRAFSLGTLANVLPVRVSLASGREGEPVPVGLTPEGAAHPIMQVLNDPGYNQKLWPLLPPLQWIADFVAAKPGAAVLLAAQNPAKTPIVAAQRYGAGRVFWMGTEESWRWRDRLGERVHQTFWLQVMRWGLAGRLRGKDPRLQAGVDRYLMASTETAELKARVSNANGDTPKEPPIVKIERIGDNGEVVPESSKSFEMLPMPQAPSIWRLSLSGLEEGWWRITASHPDASLKGVNEVRDLVVRNRNGAEGLELGSDLAGLSRMAAAGGHHAAAMDQADTLMQEFASKLKSRTQDRRETIRLWNSYPTLLVLVALLSTEWVLRKRHGLP